MNLNISRAYKLREDEEYAEYYDSSNHTIIVAAHERIIDVVDLLPGESPDDYLKSACASEVM